MQDTSPPRTRILFFRQGNFSHINDRVGGWLREQFPKQEIVEIDILQDVIKASRLITVRGAITAALTYARRIACGDHDFRDLYYRTPYLFHAIRRLVAEKYAGLAESCLFSIQTQSLYDASIEGLPHFLYTDHTHLAQLRYPGAGATQLLSPGWIKLESALYHRVRTNLVMSAFIRDSLIEDYGCEASAVAVVGAAPNLPPPSTPLENANYSNRTILFVGVDWERKGGPVLLEAFGEVVKKIPDARLIIAGCSPEVEMANAQVVGRVPLAEISRLLLHSSVFAMPSWKEPQGIAPIEAMMHGVPAIATSVGALPEVIEDGRTGRIIAPGDAAGLGNALIELLTDPALCRRYGEAARESALARYSSRVVSKRMGDAIRGALGPGA